MKIISFIQFIIHYDYSTILFWYKIVAGIVSAAFIAGIIYAAIKTQEVFAKYRSGAGLTAKKAPQNLSFPSSKNIIAWERIRSLASSDDANERKMAMIGADSLLDKIFEMQGYAGENLGARLKQIERSDLDSLNDLWEAHKVRNRIAHEASFILSREEALLAISRYEKVLKELRYL